MDQGDSRSSVYHFRPDEGGAGAAHDGGGGGSDHQASHRHTLLVFTPHLDIDLHPSLTQGVDNLLSRDHNRGLNFH